MFVLIFFLCFQAEVQSVFSDGALSLHTRSLKYGKVSDSYVHTDLQRDFYRDFVSKIKPAILSCLCKVDPHILSQLSLNNQLGQGVLVQLSPSLIKRQKTHFHNLPCGASIILGNNGFVWLYPTPEHLEEEAGGFYTSLEVGPKQSRNHK